MLTPAEINSFVSDGYLVLPDTFPRELADTVCDLLWDQLPERRDAPTTWTRPRSFLRHSIRDACYEALYTDRLRGGIDDLLGQDRWKDAGLLEAHQIAFPGHASGAWKPPSGGWHVDGSWFHHYIDGVFQALVLLPIWTDILPGGGGTAIKPSSHLIGARICAEAGSAGLNPTQISDLTYVACKHLPSVDLTARAGDVVIMHHFTLHSASENRRDSVRMITNMYVHLKTRPNFTRAFSQHSPFEQAIIHALDKPDD